jgi:hypothetical protein
MLEYEYLKPSFEFLAVPKNNKKHWSDIFGWTMVEFMHQAVMRVIRVVVQVAHYIVLRYDEVSTIDN